MRLRNVTMLALLFIGLAVGAPAQAGSGEKVEVSGIVSLAGIGPMANGMILFFSDSTRWPPPAGTWPRPDYWAAVDADGKFLALVAPGRYRVGGLERNPADGFGAPKPGELFFTWKGENGRERIVNVGGQGDLDLGVISSAP